MAHQQAELVRIRIHLQRVFTPESPISHRDSFQGRQEEIAKIVETVLHAGAHAAIFGERGVGKTSLAGLTEQFWIDSTKDSNILTGRVNCEPLDDYISIWVHIADDLASRMTLEQRSQNPQFVEYITRLSSGEVDPSFVRRTFQSYSGVVVLIIDEFDRLSNAETVKRFADTIKGFSDYAVDTTLVIVGVADTIDQLIADHASVDRSLTQILLPRFEPDELRSLIKTRYDSIGLGYQEGVIEFMANLTHGFPYYAHLVGQSAGLAAVRNQRTVIEADDVFEGLEIATENAQESVKWSYYDAVSSTRTNSIHRKVMLACAIAELDEFGYFKASDIRKPLSDILESPVDVARYLRYLSDFASDARGNVLKREGLPWRQRYRFTNPLMETFVILKGFEDEMLEIRDIFPEAT